jgi:hypothetical protein
MSKGRSCNVCNSPREVLAVINDQLKRKTPMSRIAKDTGYSKSAIGRHSLGCLQRQILAQARSGVRFGADPNDRMVTWSPVDNLYMKAGVYYEQHSGRETTLRESDTVIRMRYQSPTAPANPRTFTAEELSTMCNHQDDPQIQKILSTFITPAHIPDTDPVKD